MNICKQCGKKFEKNSHQQIFCGKSCRVLYNNTKFNAEKEYEYQKYKKPEKKKKKIPTISEMAKMANFSGLTYGQMVLKGMMENEKKLDNN